MWCPRCDQGYVVKAKIKKTDEVIFICEECDAVWGESTAIEKSNFKDFSLYMDERKLPPLWAELLIEKNC